MIDTDTDLGPLAIAHIVSVLQTERAFLRQKIDRGGRGRFDETYVGPLKARISELNEAIEIHVDQLLGKEEPRG